MSDQSVHLNASDLKLRGFNVFQIEQSASGAPAYSRRDYYKIALSTGHVRIHYADRTYEINGCFLFFSNPRKPYSVELLSERQSGYSCLFTEEFLKAAGRSESIQESPLFRIGSVPVMLLDAAQEAALQPLFIKMLDEQNSTYAFKDELIRTCLQLVIHEAHKIRPAESLPGQQRAATRIASLFLELLERQFPVESPGHPLALRTAQEYADHLSIHVNHLNRAVREVTGRTTSAHVTERIVGEAKALLQHTDWSVAEVAYSLGFEYPSHFNNYFKRATGLPPKSFRA